MSKLIKLSKKFEEMRQNFSKEAQTLFKEELKELFKENPDLVAIRWNQYTPHFNDGDPCTFRVGDAYFKFDDTEEDAGDYEDGFESYFEGNAKRRKLEKTVSELLNCAEPILSDAFGDGVEITANSKGFDVNVYDHD